MFSVFVPVCAVSMLPFPLNLSLSFHLPPNSHLPLQHTYTRVCCACFSPPLIQIIFASRNGNEVHLRVERVRLQRACCSLSVWLTEDLGSLKGDDEKDAEIYPPLSLLALHIQKKHLYCCWCCCTQLKGLLWESDSLHPLPNVKCWLFKEISSLLCLSLLSTSVTKTMSDTLTKTLSCQLEYGFESPLDMLMLSNSCTI